MNETRRKLLVRGLSSLCVVGIVVGVCGWGLYLPLSLRVSFAEDQTRIFDDMRSQALAGDATEAARCLQYIVGYYPSGTKQTPASRLDRIVERSRAHATADIIAHLRARTGSDLGPNAEPWIRRYATQP